MEVNALVCYMCAEVQKNGATTNNKIQIMKLKLKKNKKTLAYTDGWQQINEVGKASNLTNSTKQF